MSEKRRMIVLGDAVMEEYSIAKARIQLQQLPLDQFYAAVGRFGGPIALLYRRYEAKKYKLPQKYDTHILVFSGKGELRRFIPFDLKERIIIFSLNLEEELLIVYATGAYSLYDSASGLLLKSGSYIPAEGEEVSRISVSVRCIGAELIADKLLILRERVLGVVEGLGGVWRAVPAIKIHLQNQVFCGIMNGEGELQILYLGRQGNIECLNYTKWISSSNPQSSVVLCQDKDVKKAFSSLISFSKSNEVLLLIFEDRAIYIRLGSNDLLVHKFGEVKVSKDDPSCKSRSKYRYKNSYQISWLSPTLPCFCDHKRLFMFGGKQGAFFTRSLSSSALNYLLQQIDGCKLMEQNFYLYRITADPIYLNQVQQYEYAKNCGQTAEWKQLYQAYLVLYSIYNRYVSREVVQMKQCSQTPKQLVEEVSRRLEQAAGFCINVQQQLRILRFTTFLRSYWQCGGSGEEGKRLSKLSHELRIVNNLRYEQHARCMTLAEFRALSAFKGPKDFVFLMILLRYNQHYLGDLIFEDSRSKCRIFVHWAKCKIQKEGEGSVLEQIKSRYSQMQESMGSTTAFTELAKHCLQRQRPALAFRLIELEQNPGRKVVVSLLVLTERKDAQFLDRILDFTEQSAQPELVYLVLKTLRKASGDWLSPQIWTTALPRRPLLENHYLRLLKELGEQQQLQRYLTGHKQYLQLGYRGLKLQLKPQMALDKLKQLIGKDYTKLLPGLSDAVSKIEYRKNINSLRDLREKKYPITEQDGKGFQKDGDFECLAEMILSKDDNLPLAVKFLRQIKSDKVYQLLLRKGKPKDALQVAYQRRNKLQLRNIIDRVEGDIKSYGEELYSLLLSHPK